MEKQNKPIIINGKQYPMWEQFVHQKNEWIGGELIQDNISFKIVDVILEANGNDSAIFGFKGVDDNKKECSFCCDVKYIGIGSNSPTPYLDFSAPYGLSFMARKNCKN